MTLIFSASVLNGADGWQRCPFHRLHWEAALGWWVWEGTGRLDSPSYKDAGDKHGSVTWR